MGTAFERRSKGQQLMPLCIIVKYDANMKNYNTNIK